jgi:CheY-like chemotaxis protein
MATILIVDDETNIRLTLRTSLEGGPYHILQAANGQEALAAIAGSSPDLMILDLAMPILDGMAVLEQLTEHGLAIMPRVIVLTAHGSVPDAVKAMRLGASDFLEKPILPEALRLSVAAVLEEAARDQQPSPEPDVGYSGLLQRIREDLWRHDYKHAETLLMDAAWAANNDPAYFNLIGVLHEAEGRKRLAKRFYKKAIGTTGQYEPARLNLQRLQDLDRYGKTVIDVQLGDEGKLLSAFSGSATKSSKN